jgi:hypothetical protein
MIKGLQVLMARMETVFTDSIRHASHTTSHFLVTFRS